MEDTLKNENANRYGSFAELYNLNRPVPPKIIIDIIQMYLESEPQTIVDIGSGTGLSTFIWKDISKQIIGIEPDDRMRKIAEENKASDNILFKKGFSHETGLQSESVDVVTISQAFHWMDIEHTFDEVYRILKPEGVLAVFDCLPPSVDWVIEKEFNLLRGKCDRIAIKKMNAPLRNMKSTGIDAFRTCGKFKFVKEINCHSVEECTCERLLGLALSQGNIQEALKVDANVQRAVDKFYEVIKERCAEKFEIVFSYNLRLAIK